MAFESFIALGLYFAVMLGIGIFSYRTATSDNKDYLLGGRRVSPKVTALSAGASDMSGWMLMGLPGAMFTIGYDTLVIAIGLSIGAFFNYQIVAARLRSYSEKANDAITLPSFFSERFGRKQSILRAVMAIVILLFFTLYTSSGLVAGGKFFESAFALNYQLGIVITAVVVVSYTLLGGYLAVSLTDFIQGSIMFVALVLVPIVAYQHFESFGEITTLAHQTIPSPSGFLNGLTVLGVCSSLAWGLGYFGQPHIIVRFMAITQVSDVPTARNIGMSWMLTTLIGAVSTGLIGLAYVNKFSPEFNDPETIFVFFSTLLFHPLITGFLLAAILAAVMSTISSQLLVSSSALTEDLFHAIYDKPVSDQTLVSLGRISVLVICIIAASLAWSGNSSVLSLVGNAWAGFGAAFGPLVIASLHWRGISYAGALSGIFVGTGTVLFWIFVPVLPKGETLSSLIYELVPGFIASALSIYIVSLLTHKTDTALDETFNAMENEVKQGRTSTV